jgi:hypothetical protein
MIEHLAPHPERVTFDPEAYWRDREHKKWVVVVTSYRGSETRYIGATDKEGAENCAIERSYLEGHKSAFARLATPRDLGCVPTFEGLATTQERVT